MAVAFDLDSKKLRDDVDLAKTLGHDTLVVRFKSQFLEAHRDDPDFSADLRISLKLGSKVLDRRAATLPRRRHQFLVPISDALFRDKLSCEIETVRLTGSASPAFEITFETAAHDQLVDSIEEKMVWIFGSPRSGSTWVASDILGKLPSRALPSDDTGSRPIDEMGLGLALGAFVFEPEHFFGIEKIESHRDPGPDFETVAGRRQLSGEAIFQRHLFKNYGQPEAMLSEITRDAVRDMIRQLTFQHILLHWGIFDYDRVVFKAPNEGHAADLIMNALPKSRMIFLVRDGRDVIRSRFSPFASRVLAETGDAALRRAAVAYYAHQWNWHTDIVRRAYEAHDPNRRLCITYEELRREEWIAFWRLTNFVGATLDTAQIRKLMEDVRLENYPPETRGSHLPRQDGQIGGYRTAFSAEEQHLMTAILAENLRHFGYAV